MPIYRAVLNYIKKSVTMPTPSLNGIQQECIKLVEIFKLAVNSTKKIRWAEGVKVVVAHRPAEF